MSTIAAAPAGIASAGGPSDRARRRDTQRVARASSRTAIASGDLARMWWFLDRGGVVSQPFTNTTITDFATFQSTFSGFFSVAQGLQLHRPKFVDLLDPDGTDREVPSPCADHLDRTCVRSDVHHRVPRAGRQSDVVRRIFRHVRTVRITRARRSHPGLASSPPRQLAPPHFRVPGSLGFEGVCGQGASPGRRDRGRRLTEAASVAFFGGAQVMADNTSAQVIDVCNYKDGNLRVITPGARAMTGNARRTRARRWTGTSRSAGAFGSSGLPASPARRAQRDLRRRRAAPPPEAPVRRAIVHEPSRPRCRGGPQTPSRPTSWSLRRPIPFSSSSTRHGPNEVLPQVEYLLHLDEQPTRRAIQNRAQSTIDPTVPDLLRTGPHARHVYRLARGR